MSEREDQEQGACASVQSTTDSNVFIRSRKTYKKCHKNLKKKRTQRIVLQPLDPPLLNQPLLNNDMWDINKLNIEYNSLYDVVNKRKQIIERANAPRTFGLRKSFHLWRDNRLREQYYTHMENLQNTINTTEESIRLWLSAIVMQKWSSRRDAMTYINDLDASIALHEFRLDNMDEEYEESNSLLKEVTAEANRCACMLMFNEAVTHAAHMKKQSSDASTSDDVDSDEEDDGFVGFMDDSELTSSPKNSEKSPSNKKYDGFNSYNEKRLDVAVCLSQVQQQIWNGTFDSSWNPICIRKGSDEDCIAEHWEIASRLKTSLIYTQKLHEHVQQLKKRQKREIIILAVANRMKNNLKQVSGFVNSTKVVQTTKEVVNTDGRNFFISNDSDSDCSGVSDGGFQRGALNDHFTSRKEQRESLKHMHDCENQLRILAKAEEDAKENLVQIIELKLDCQELMETVQQAAQAETAASGMKKVKVQQPVPNAIIVGIIWGSAGVAVPVVKSDLTNVNAEDYVDIGVSGTLKLCRTANKDTKIDCTELLSAHGNGKPTLEEDIQVSKVVENLHNKDQKFGNTSTSTVIYIKELQNTDLSVILNSLQAEKVYIDRKESIYFPEYFDFMRSFQSNALQEEEAIKREHAERSSRSRSRSFSDSINRMSSLIGGFISNNASDASSCDEDDDRAKHKYSTSTGFGLLFKLSPESIAREQQYTFISTLEKPKTIVLGAADLLSIYVQDTTYQAVLGAFSFRDYMEQEGYTLPIVMYNPETSKWIGLTHSMQKYIIFSFSSNCKRNICMCHDAICQCPSLPFRAPPSMRINLNKYTTKIKKKSFFDTMMGGESSGVDSAVDSLVFTGSWPCLSSEQLSVVFSSQDNMKSEGFQKTWSLLEMGIVESVASHNAEGAKQIVQAATGNLLKFPKNMIMQEATPALSGSLRSKLIRSTVTIGDIVAPFEEVLTHVYDLLDNYDNKGNGNTRMDQERNTNTRRYNANAAVNRVAALLIPLGAVRIILSSVLRQTTRRVSLACNGLAKWIDLSSSVAFRVLSSFYISTIDSDDSSDDDHSDDAVLGIAEDEEVDETSYSGSLHSLLHNGLSMKKEPSIHDTRLIPKRKHRISFFIRKKQKNMDSLLQMRIPILGSIGVKVRAEMYHDLLDLQIKTSSGRHYSSSIYANNAPGGGSDPNRQSYSIDTADGTDMMIGLCRMLLSLHKDKQYNGADGGAVRQTIRFHLLQCLLGLDERWTLDQTAVVCQLVIDCVATAARGGAGDIAPAGGVNVPQSLESCGHAFSWNGRRSNILSEASFNILSRGVPSHLFGALCSVRFSVASGGGSIISFLDAAESKYYQACFIVIKDSIGHVFGGFVNQQLKKSREYYGNGECFVFSVFPSTKLYPWSKRNDYCMYLTDQNVGMGGGGKGFSFLLDDDLCHGSSSRSDTFQNPTLSFTEQFQCTELELIVFE